VKGTTPLCGNLFFFLERRGQSENKKERGDVADESSNCSLVSTIPLSKEGGYVESEVGPEVIEKRWSKYK
jgi:hypothetical protein